MVATLSMGPVGIGDGPGMTNVTLVKQIARADARLIHPSYPATPIDVMYYPPSLRPSGEIWQVGNLAACLRRNVSVTRIVMCHLVM